MKPFKPALLVLIVLLASGIVSVRAQSTAFTYQGRLRDNTIPAVGAFDLRFTLYDAFTGGSQVGLPVTANDVAVTNGLFCVVLDFGVDAFAGAERWLETALRPGAETGDYTVLTPRRALTATPYALYAPNAGKAGTATSVPAVNLTGTVPLARLPGEVVTNNETGLTLSGTFSGSGASLTGVNADQLDDHHGTFYQDAANLNTGIVPLARLPGEVVTNNEMGLTLSGTFSGSGASLTGVDSDELDGEHGAYYRDAANLNTGIVPLARLPGEVVTNNETGLTLSGTFSGSGASLAGVNSDKLDGEHATFYQDATHLTTGTLSDARLSGNVALLNASQVFTGSNLFSGAGLFAGAARMTNTGNLFVGTHAGDGASLSNLNAAYLTGTAPIATDFSGALAGDVTGAQGHTVVAAVGGVTAINVASGANAANAATSANMPNTIVKRDSTGSFAAETVTGHFVGDGSGLTNITAANVVGGGGTVALPSGITFASLLPNDAGLLASGCRLMMTVPALPWVSSPAVGGASGRFGHTAIWDGNRLIIWGGRLIQGSSYLNSGGLYSPDADEWQTASTVDAPTARWGHTAIWSGSEMLVWGGNGANGWLNTGGRFQPSTGLWRSITTNGAASARSEHVAVWVGSRMLIWGGRNALGLANDGAFYNPGLDQWSAVTQVDAPEARIGATAVWATDRVLIWGGEGAYGALNSGSELRSPSGVPQWATMTSDNAPIPRRGHSAIWTGSKMIIWGGQNSGTPLADGAAYDPAAGAWESLPVTGAPAARFNHVAIWTGEEMVIVGGSNGTAEFASGAAFNPATGVWRSLSGAGNPRARTESTAAWTGTEVLVFGGRAHGQAIDALQRLVPQPVWYFYRKL